MVFEVLARLEPYLPRVGQISVVVLGSFIAYRFVRVATSHLTLLARGDEDAKRRAQREQRAGTLAAILQNLARVVLIAYVLVMFLSVVGLDITPLLAGAGVVGLAVGFGAQSLVKDFLAGFFIVLENQFGIGDTVTVAGVTGTVERMTLRVTVLSDPEGSVYHVPNGKIDTVVVLSKEWARATVDVTLPFREDLVRALEVASEVATSFASENADSVTDPPEVLGVHDLGPRGMTIRVAAKTPPGKNYPVARELRRRLKLAFDREGLSLAHGDEDEAPPPPRAK